MKTIFLLMLSLATSVFLSSFQVVKKGVGELPKAVGNTYAFIPAGKVYMEKDSAEVNSFYILKTEISNLSYREFLSYLRKNDKMEEFSRANFDTLNWKNEFSYNEPYVDYYHRHPAYNNYPAVNMSYEGAILYCRWLTEMFNQAYGQNYTYEVRLPSRNEWLRAVQLDSKTAVYAWGGSFLINSRGQPLCNYKPFGDAAIHTDEATGNYVLVGARYGMDNTDITAPVISYYPGKAGLYNMNGNVAEMVTEQGTAVGGSWHSTGYDVRNESTMKYSKSSPFVGFRPVLIVKKRTILSIGRG